MLAGTSRRARIAAVAGVVALLAVVVVVVLVRRRPGPLDCEAAAKHEPFGTTIMICKEEYERTHQPAAGALLADALHRSGDNTTAAGIAKDLLTTEEAGEAHRILGQIASTEDRLDDAVTELERARALHRKEQHGAKLARADVELAEVYTRRSSFAEALQVIEECITEASEEIKGYCHLNAARVLGRVGYFDGASQELDHAKPLLTSDYDQAYLWTEYGSLEQEVGHHRQAVGYFQRALQFAKRAQLAEQTISIELNLVYSLAELRQAEEAERHLAEATRLDRDQSFEGNRRQLTARIAYRRGNLTLAYSLNEKLFPVMPPGDDRFEMCVMQARIAIALADYQAAERWTRCGIADAEQIRAAQTTVELRPWVLASRRTPYEQLFAVLAHGKRFEEAVVVFDQWQGRTLLDVMARPSRDPTPGLASAAGKVQHLGKWLPVASTAPLMTTSGRAVVEALRTTDLLGLAIAEGDVWRVAASRGQIQIEKLGAYEALRDQLDRFEANPTDRALATELGDRLVPPELLRDRSTLHIVLDAPLATLPIVALRPGGKALVAVRPVLRIPRLLSNDLCTPPTPTGGAKVLADAKGDLPKARDESRRVAELLHTTALVGNAATSEALFAAKTNPVLHVAVHANADAGGGVLQLHDREVTALEISATKLGPSLVVLSGCSTARSEDPELAASLSTAFLASGSSQVVATLRTVSDEGALELTRRFYADGGVKDPVRTLAAIQAKLADGDTKDWPSFAVFGHDVCGPKG